MKERIETPQPPQSPEATGALDPLEEFDAAYIQALFRKPDSDEEAPQISPDALKHLASLAERLPTIVEDAKIDRFIATCPKESYFDLIRKTNDGEGIRIGVRVEKLQAEQRAANILKETIYESSPIAHVSLASHLIALTELQRRVSENQGSDIPAPRQLPNDYKEAAEATLVAEWLEWMAIYIKQGEELGRTITRPMTENNAKKRPLIYRPLADLKQALGDPNNHLSGSVTVELFTSGASDFSEACARKNAETLERRSSVAAKLAQKALDRDIAEQQNIHNAEQQMNAFFAQYDDRPEVAAFVTNPTAELHLDETSDTDGIINYLYAIERYKQTGDFTNKAPIKRPSGAKSYDVIETPVADALRPDRFYGRLEAVRIRHLAIDTSIEAIFKKTFTRGVQPDEVELLHALLVDADMRVTGKGIVGKSMQPVVIYRYGDGVHISLSKLAKGDQQQVTDAANAQSAENARAIEAQGLLNPLQGGLPSLGKSGR